MKLINTIKRIELLKKATLRTEYLDGSDIHYQKLTKAYDKIDSLMLELNTWKRTGDRTQRVSKRRQIKLAKRYLSINSEYRY